MDRKDMLHWVFIASLFVMVIIMFLQVEELKEELVQTHNRYIEYKEEATKDINSKELEIEALEEEKEELQRSLSKKEKEFQALKARYENLTEDYEGLQEEASQILRTIDDYREELNDSMEWFRTNANLEGLNISSKDRSRIESLLKYRCIEKDRYRCTINTGCIYLVNAQFLEFDYLNDTSTSFSEDKLQSLSEFVDNKGGDCEDFALFYKAELNFLLDECKESTSEYVLESWRPASDENKRFWLDDSHQWFLREAARMLLVAHKYPYVVCGMILDPVKDKIGGHCVIAASKEKIESIEDIEKLNGAALIEPQNGRYLGDVGEDVMLIKKIDDFSYNSYISQIITDSDMLSFSKRRNQWEGFALFSEELEEVDNKLKAEIRE